MRGERYNKKGLSPLIATILLIAFAVSLGTLIMTWSFGESSESSDLCSDVNVNLQQTQGEQAVCYDPQGQHIRFIVESTGEESVDSFALRVINQDLDIQEKVVQADLRGIGRFEISYETASPNGLTAIITPIKGENECSDNKIQTDVIRLC